MSDILLRIEHLKKYFQTNSGLVHAVDDVTFKIGRGKTLGVVGESGCGKSTLGRTVLRLLPATSGSIYFEGADILSFNKYRMKQLRREMQIIFQDPYASLNPRMTVATLIGESLRVNHLCTNKAETEERVRQIMKTVGLAERLANVYPHELDGGRRQRIGLARALILNPKFIVCDEPVSALDVSIQAQILNLMMDIQEQMGPSYLFITHNLSVVKHISDEIAVMYLGKIVEKAPADELFENPKHPYTKALLAAIPIPEASSRNRKHEILQGEISSPINPKPGCRFAARCPFAMCECRKTDPPFLEVTPGHYAACFKI